MKHIRTFAAAALLYAGLCPHAWTQPAPAGASPWRDVAESAFAHTGQRRLPLKYRTLDLDVPGLQRVLAAAPKESQPDARSQAIRLALPLPNGRFGEFRVVESPIMQDELAAKFPQIRTYLAWGVSDPTATARMDLTPKGFRAQVLSADGTVFIDPYQNDDTSHYISYDKRDYLNPGNSFQCAVDDKPSIVPHGSASPGPAAALASGDTRRTYRLAVSASSSYTIALGGTVADAMAGIVSTVNRITGLYEREFSLRLVLVNNNDLLVFPDPAADPFVTPYSLLDTNQHLTDRIIGNANYDLGHVFLKGGGGVATLGVLCSRTSKARGKSGISTPYGDAFDINHLAHEMGHQFGAHHSFNGGLDSCGSSYVAQSAYETGSGSTIMAYPGNCDAEDLQPSSDDYYHRISLDESFARFAAIDADPDLASCGTRTSSGNTPAAFTIPARTPFLLAASGSDADGDTLTYAWEQFDLGDETFGGPLVDDGTRPLFRSFRPTTNPTRLFPSLRFILDNANVVPEQAPLPGTTALQYTGELLPTTSRTLNFRVTVRDNHAGAGGTNEAATALTVVGSAGPFAVTAPNTAVSWAAGSARTVSWNVAGTNTAPISTSNVAISLSLDGGQTWPVVLAANAPNSGSASVTVPAGTPASGQARVKVAAVGNVYFDISDTNFSITTAANSPPSLAVNAPVTLTRGGPAVAADVAVVSDAQTAAGSLAVALSQIPPDLTASVVNNAGTIRVTAQASCKLVQSQSSNTVYPILLTVTDAAGATAAAYVYVSQSENALPTLGTYASTALTRSASANVTPSAPPADANGNYVGISVSPTTLPGGGTVSVAANGTVGITTTAATTLGYHTLRVSATDTCGATEMRDISALVATAPPLLNLRSAAVTSGNQLIEPGECNSASVTLANEGVNTASAIASTLSTSTPGVTIAQATSPYATLLGNSSGANTTAFQISTAASLACFSTIDFTQTITYTGGGSPRTVTFSLPVGRVAGPNYQFTASSGGAITPTGTLVPNSAVDDAVVPVTVPFNFSVGSVAVSAGSTIQAGSNGNIQFVASGACRDPANTLLPAFGTTSKCALPWPADAPILFPYWDDLDLRGAGNGIFSEVTGMAPNRSWKLHWRGVLYDTSTAIDFAVFLHEGSNRFEFVYDNDADADGSEATIGWQAADHGTAYVLHSANTATVTPGLQLAGTLTPAICSVGPGVCNVDLIFRNGFEP